MSKRIEFTTQTGTAVSLRPGITRMHILVTDDMTDLKNQIPLTDADVTTLIAGLQKMIGK